MKKALAKIIRLYQLVVSPHLPRACRFYPSCSQYAVLAIEKKGLAKGILASLWRILRCNPSGKEGIDLP